MNKIWVDADACPVAVRDILFRAGERTGVEITLVANQPLRVPPGSKVTCLQVAPTIDAADNEIATRVLAGDLVITSDIPLAAAVVKKSCVALSPRGTLYTAENIEARLSMRDFLETMRASGFDTGGPAPFNQADRKAFADRLDQLLARRGGG